MRSPTLWLLSAACSFCLVALTATSVKAQVPYYYPPYTYYNYPGYTNYNYPGYTNYRYPGYTAYGIPLNNYVPSYQNQTPTYTYPYATNPNFYYYAYPGYWRGYSYP